MTHSQEGKLVSRRRSTYNPEVKISKNYKINIVNILKEIEIIQTYGQNEWKENLKKILLTKMDVIEIKYIILKIRIY